MKGGCNECPSPMAVNALNPNSCQQMASVPQSMCKAALWWQVTVSPENGSRTCIRRFIGHPSMHAHDSGIFLEFFGAFKLSQTLMKVTQRTQSVQTESTKKQLQN